MTSHDNVTVMANGTALTLPFGSTVGDLAKRFGLSENAILVECNGEALFRAEWPIRPLSEGDRIEFIRMVAGG